MGGGHCVVAAPLLLRIEIHNQLVQNPIMVAANSSAGLSPAFIDGFVAECYNRGLTLDDTETLFCKHANAQYLATPGIYEGFRQGLQNSGLSKAALARFLSPDILATAVDCRIKYGHDALSCLLRESAGMPEPDMETVGDELQKVASAIGQQLSSFQSLPLNQQLLIASLVGAGAGGVKRLFMPNDEDQAEGRGPVSRAVRGAGRGAATGAGAAGGAALGASMGGRQNRLGGALAGGATGAIAGNQLAKMVTG